MGKAHFSYLPLSRCLFKPLLSLLRDESLVIGVKTELDAVKNFLFLSNAVEGAQNKAGNVQVAMPKRKRAETLIPHIASSENGACDQ